MRFVCIFLPALCALGIQSKRTQDKPDITKLLIRYGLWVLFINLISMLCVSYIIRIDGVVEDAMTSFSFACKYIVISLIPSIILPYIIEMFGKYFSISFEVTSKASDNEKKD